MIELRQDPITRDWVIVNAERAHRPRDTRADDAHCPFCPGHEASTPASVDALVDVAGRWLVRAVPNRFPALGAMEAGLEHRYAAEGWHYLPGYGHHEVIIETPDHNASIGSMSPAQLRQALEMYSRRYRALAALDGRLRQIVLFRNHGLRAGTSLTHPHAQIVATPVVAPETRWRLAEEIAYFDTHGTCGMCQVVKRELVGASRIVLAGERFVTLAPYAARVPYHLQIVPRAHCPTFLEVEPGDLDELAGHLGAVLAALQRLPENPDYNLVVVTPPLDQVHRHANHWFIDIVPRLTTPAGFELGSRIVISTIAPEQAATALRAQL